jgi:hypothetical protein
MTEDNIYVFAPYSLDGAGSYLVCKWHLELKNFKNIHLVTTNAVNANRDYKGFKDSFEYQTAKKIYIVGGYIAKEILEFIKDDEKVSVFYLKDEILDDLQGPKVIQGDHLSYTAFLYASFRSLDDVKLDEQKSLLLTFIEDYVSYELKYDRLSLGINTIFYNFQGNKVLNFCKKYENGFGGFNEEDKKVIAFYKHKLEKILESQKYAGVVTIGGEPCKIVSIFSDTCINEVAAALIKKYEADIVLIVNAEKQRVSFRKSNKVDIDLKALCQLVCEGDGKKYAATGKITEKFLTLAKLLKEVE